MNTRIYTALCKIAADIANNPPADPRQPRQGVYVGDMNNVYAGVRREPAGYQLRPNEFKAEPHSQGVRDQLARQLAQQVGPDGRIPVSATLDLVSKYPEQGSIENPNYARSRIRVRPATTKR